ncbi:hypothetical protein M5689_020530 [Euphorbia peplus]|nr:hypothetical protein M5689_020530 [Euphorbia peplus]
MSSEPPKLYANKPKKAQLKQSAPSAASSSYGMGTQSTAPPPPPPTAPPPPRKESFARRYKFFVPLILTVNLAVVGYMFMRTKKNEDSLDEEKASDVSPAQVSSATIATVPVTEKPISSSPTILEPLKPREPIPESQQRELYKWMLEEKRKVKPKDSEEKKRIDEEKAILKQFIRSKSLPTI